MISGQCRYDGWGLLGTPGSDRASGRLQGRPARGASPLGRGQGAPQEPKSENETWAEPGCRAAGRLGRVLPPAPPRWPPQPPPLRRKLPPTLGPRVRPQESAEAGASEGRTVPAGWAQLPQGTGERPPRIPRPVRETPPGLGRHIPRRTPPREHALDRRLKRCRRLCRCRGCLRRRLLRSWIDSQQPQPTAAGSLVSSGPRAPDSAHAAPPRATPRLQTGRRARTYLPRPLQPARVADSAPARDASRDYSMRLRGHAPFARPNFSSSPYGRAGNSALDAPSTRE